MRWGVAKDGLRVVTGHRDQQTAIWSFLEADGSAIALDSICSAGVVSLRDRGLLVGFGWREGGGGSVVGAPTPDGDWNRVDMNQRADRENATLCQRHSSSRSCDILRAWLDESEQASEKRQWKDAILLSVDSDKEGVRCDREAVFSLHLDGTGKPDVWRELSMSSISMQIEPSVHRS